MNDRTVCSAEDLLVFQLAVCRDRHLAPAEKLILLVLSLHYPRIALTQAAIAAECGFVPRTVRQHLGTARKAGWLTSEVQYGGEGGRGPTRYWLVLRG